MMAPPAAGCCDAGREMREVLIKERLRIAQNEYPQATNAEWADMRKRREAYFIHVRECCARMDSDL